MDKAKIVQDRTNERLDTVRRQVARTLRDIIEQAEKELRDVEAGRKLHRSTQLAVLGATVAEQLGEAESVQEQAELLAWLTGQG